MTDALGTLTTYRFDAAGRQTLRIDGRGLRTSYSYDAASRFTGQQYQDGTRVTMAYDANNERTVLSDWTGSYTSTFDPVGRLSSVVNPAGIRITYGYDAASHRAWMDQPTGLFTYSYDAASHIRNLVNPEGQVTSWSYDAASRVTAKLLANGTRASYTYDKGDHVLLLANLTSGGTTLSSFNYTYDHIGNRTQVVEANGDVVSWSYDPTYQLTNERRSGANAYNITYSYDPVGNRALMLNGGAPTTYTYNAANELATSQTSSGTTTYTFDGSGNQLITQAPGNQRTTNTWDGENRLTGMVLPSLLRNTFTYNGNGLRMQKQDSTGTTKHVWDEQNILLETDASNIIQVVYTLEPLLYGNLVSQRRGMTTSFYLFDALGSTRQLASSAGSVTDTFLYDSLGGALVTTGSTANSQRYVGRQGYYFDPDTGTYSVRTREYAPPLGRWLSCENTLRSSKLYTYCRGNVVNLSDPSALYAQRPSGPDAWKSGSIRSCATRRSPTQCRPRPQQSAK